LDRHSGEGHAHTDDSLESFRNNRLISKFA
jgi:hypothetical protein